ncbi:HNH endonuclease signature motif containing protein [Mycobacterium sp. IDR2000157661]|uniref:HNH endonuclease signature motif containing protein n=1 Tax=Mycobacterium sp. IDR2000157661 TaxID=2867005 RepID=UPI001EEEC626|nr:HNH endonuclease signature motif containing protein [Mycobacterium sp. IDR2000157661]ULE34599.1 HNH endonuclease [Mycobacterium sp. IDR2000157661]
MSSTAASDTSDAASVLPKERLAVLFEEVAQLCGQRNAIDGRLVQIVAEIDRDGLWGMTGVRSLAGLVAWKTGCTEANAKTMAAIAARCEEFPRCTQALAEGRLSLDQVGVIAQKAGAGSDAHYVELAGVATVSQLRKAISLEPRPEPEPAPRRGPERSISKTSDAHGACYRIRLSHPDAATFDAALQSHHEALIGEWKRDHNDDEHSAGEHGAGEQCEGGGQVLPFPTVGDGFMRLVEAGWDAEAARRPHSAHTTVIVHLDVDKRAAALHLGPLLTDAERRYLTCDATYQTWFDKDGQTLGCGRTTRQISRRLRRALEFRHRTCAVPGCGATRGLHAHHIIHWEDGGATELDNLVLVCPYHHRMHHRGLITIVGPAPAITVFDDDGEPLHPGSLARPPTQPPPDVPPCPGPLGERAQWWWYDPYQPQPPPSTDN